MKLKVRQGKQTVRIQVGDSCTLGELQHIVGVEFGSRPERARLSLNNKTELDGTANQQLRIVGVTGGDLLWLLPACTTGETVPVSALVPAASSGEATNGVLATPRPESEAEPAHMDLYTACAATSAGAAQGKATRGSEGVPKAVGQDLYTQVEVANPGPQSPLLSAVHALFLDAGFRPAADTEDGGQGASLCLRLSPSAVTRQRLDYTLTIPSRQTCSCSVTLTKLGRFSVVTSSVQGRPSHTISLDGGRSFQPSAAGAGRVAARDARELWIQLKDGIIRPTVTDVRAVLGMADSPGLQNLPSELAENILQRLEAPELVALLGTCRATNALASADALWQRLAQRDFGLQAPGDEEDARRLGWRCIYRIKHVEREAERRSEDSRRAFQRRRPYPFLGSGPAGPFAGRARIAPYRQIGGDYDRNPLLLQGPEAPFRPFLGGFGSRGAGGLRFA